MTVSELVERGREFDQVAMPDPIEGSGYGLTTAKFYFNDGQSPCIHSFAHGVRRVYRLGQTDDFTPCDYEVIRLEEPLPATPTSSGNPLVEFSLRGMSGQLEKEFEDQVLLLGLIILMYQSSVIYAAPNTGKTLIILRLLINAIRQGKIDPSNVFYINVDDTPNGLVEKLKFADEYGFHMLAEGYNGFRANDLLGILAELIMSDQAKGVIIILDTLKKFTDLMDKRLSSRFSHAIRQFIMRGGTCISLAHTNKHRNSDGKPVYAGTTDIIDDADCAYLMYEINLDVDAGTKTVLFENIKARGNVARQVAYRYSIAEGRSYREMLDSVEPVDDIEASSLQQAAEIESDAQTLDAITECIREGIDYQDAARHHGRQTIQCQQAYCAEAHREIYRLEPREYIAGPTRSAIEGRRNTGCWIPSRRAPIPPHDTGRCRLSCGRIPEFSLSMTFMETIRERPRSAPGQIPIAWTCVKYFIVLFN